MQYGDLSMDKDCLQTYFSAHHATCSNGNSTYCISIKFAYLISIVLFVIALYIIWTKCSNWCATLVQIWLDSWQFQFSLIYCFVTNTCWRLFWKGIGIKSWSSVWFYTCLISNCSYFHLYILIRVLGLVHIVELWEWE